MTEKPVQISCKKKMNLKIQQNTALGNLNVDFIRR